MRAHHRSILATVIIAVVAACGGGDEAEQASMTWRTVVDTVGDTVVARTLGVSDSAATLGLVPELRIGELEGADEYTFGGVGIIAPASDGGVYVWDFIPGALRQYDAAGTFVRQLGARGAGPGEYDTANDVVVLPDGRVLLWDPRHARINVYAADGTPQEAWRSPSGLFSLPPAMWVDTAGRVAILDWIRPAESLAPERGAPTEPVTVLLVLGPDGAVTDTLVPPVPAAVAPLLVASHEGRTSYEYVPFSPAPVWTRLPTGEFVTGRGDRYALTVHRVGAPPLRIERDVPAVTVEGDEADDAREWLTARMRGVDPNWRWNGPGVPETKPFFTRLLTAADGRIWVERPQRGERLMDEEYADAVAAQSGRRGTPIPPRRWRQTIAYDVFDADGRFLGHVAPPPRTTLRLMYGDQVWGVTRDSLDVNYVVRYGLSPAPSATIAQ